MQPSIHIDRPGARVYDEALVSAAVARSAYPLPGAEVRYWVGQGWRVLEQGYDLNIIDPAVYGVQSYGQVLFSSGVKASSAGIVATSL